MVAWANLSKTVFIALLLELGLAGLAFGLGLVLGLVLVTGVVGWLVALPDLE